jgi:hypothetical protein
MVVAMNRMVVGCVLSLVALLLLLEPAGARSFEEKSYEIGIAGGILLSGDVYISLHGDDVERSSNILFRGFVDSYVVPKLAVGAYIAYSTLNLKEDIEIGFWGDDEEYRIEKSGISALELGGAIKPRFIISHRVAVKPGITIGYRKFFGETDFSTWQALGIGGSCEVQFRANDTMILYQETGFLSQPTGGNVDTDVTFGPTFYLLFGVAI